MFPANMPLLLCRQALVHTYVCMYVGIYVCRCLRRAPREALRGPEVTERPREGPGKVMAQNGQGGTRESPARRGARGGEVATGR